MNMAARALNELKRKYRGLKVPVLAGGLRLAYDPDPQNPYKWGVNDHTLIQAEDGRIHFFGIENPFLSTAEALELVKHELEQGDRPWPLTSWKMMLGSSYTVRNHYRVGHAVADSIWGPWEQLPPAFDGMGQGDDGGIHPYGSPYVLRHGGRYWMFVPEGWNTKKGATATGIYISEDLTAWQPVEGTRWTDPAVFGTLAHRDPCILRLDDGTFLQYFAAGDEAQSIHIGLASSKDLQHWSREAHAYVEDFGGTKIRGGGFESPFITCKDGLYYLLVGWSHRHYYETLVLVSQDPRHFDPADKVTTLFAHAPELIRIDGIDYISSCGFEDPQEMNRSGLWISELDWLQP